MESLSASRGIWRRAALTLATIALVLKIAIPPGMMVGPPQVTAGLDIPLVICTGHGMLVISEPGSPKQPGHRHTDAPCAFASSNATSTPLLMAAISEPVRIEFVIPPTAGADDLAPGRGLAAPPPPSHAPPQAPELT